MNKTDKLATKLYSKYGRSIRTSHSGETVWKVLDSSNETLGLITISLEHKVNVKFPELLIIKLPGRTSPGITENHTLKILDMKTNVTSDMVFNGLEFYMLSPTLLNMTDIVFDAWLTSK